MLARETTRQEIEERLSHMGDYVKIDYLSACLKNKIDFDTRKFVLIKLAGLYENSKMFLNAAEAMKSAADINTTVQSKINDFMKAVNLYVKGGNYQAAESYTRLAASYGSEKQKSEIDHIVKEFYKTQAKIFLNENKRKNAAQIYEILLEMKLEERERQEFIKILLESYEKLGKVREYYSLKNKKIS